MEQQNSFQQFPVRLFFPHSAFLILIIILLAGCNRATPELLTTTLPNESPTPTILPSATRTPLPLFTPTMIPTATPSPTPGIFNRVPVPPNAGRFFVTTPDVKLLWDVVRMAGKVDERDGDSDHLKNISETERNAIYRLIEHDLQSYDPLDIPGAMELIEDTDFQAVGYEPFISNLISEHLIIKINLEQIKFTSEESFTVVDFHLIPYLLELDGDANNEWLLQVTNSRLRFSGWIFVDEYKTSAYRMLYSDPLTMPFGNQNAQVAFGHDLTGDGLEEIVFSFFEYAWGSKFGFVQVFTWDGTRLVRILELEKYIRSTDFWNLEDLIIDFKIGDVNGDGRKEIQVKLPRSANFGCEWDELGIYRWEGMEPKFQLKGASPPETPICWAAQGFNPASDLTEEQKVHFLEKAQSSLPSASASPDLLALLRVHMAVRYTILGKDTEARQSLLGIERFSSSNALVKIIQDNYHAANGSLVELCDGLYRFAQEGLLPEDNQTISHLSYSSSLGAYGFDTSPYPPMLCPLHDLAKHQLENAKLPLDSSPLEFLKSMGYPIEAAAEVQLDDDEEKEITAVIALGEPQIIVLDRDQEAWNVSRASRLSAPVENVQFVAYDIYQDGKKELLVSAMLQKPVPHSAFTSCWGPDAGETTQFIVIQKVGSHYGASWGDELCGDKQDLDTFIENNRFEFALLQGGTLSSDQSLAEVFRRKYAFSLYELPKLENRDLWHGIDQLLDEILKGNGTVLSEQKTKVILAWISPEAPGGERIIQRMMYFSGIIYERNGQTEKAGMVYQHLVQEWPDSIWSWLAWARIKVANVTG